MKVASAGSVMVMVLVFFLVFVVIMMAWLGFTSRQHNAVLSQEQEEQSFNLSEAGINWALHALNSEVCTPAELATYTTNAPLVQSVVDESVDDGAGPVGTYELSFTTQGALTMVHALGYDVNVPRECQLVEATLESFTGGLGTKYRLRSWDHKSTVNCGTAKQVTVSPCGG